MEYNEFLDYKYIVPGRASEHTYMARDLDGYHRARGIMADGRHKDARWLVNLNCDRKMRRDGRDVTLVAVTETTESQ